MSQQRSREIIQRFLQHNDSTPLYSQTMNHSRGGGGQKRDRSSGWGSYYAHKRKEQKDRRDRFPQDSSDAMAINAGVQPTLARRRRQLADDKWEASSGNAHSEADKIADDLRAIHAQQQNSHSGGRDPHNRAIANNMVRNARYRFWKRKLSHLSTQDFEDIWRTGQAKFKQQIAPPQQQQQQQGKDASTGARTPGAPTSGATSARSHVGNPKDGNRGQSPSTNTTTNATGTMPSSRTGNGNRPRANSAGRGQPSSSSSMLSATRPSPPTALASASSAPPHQEVIDLCDSDSDSDDDDAGDQTNTNTRWTDAGSPTNHANHKTTDSTGNEHDKNHTRASATNVRNNDTKNTFIEKDKNANDASEKEQPWESPPKATSSSTTSANDSPLLAAVRKSPATTSTATRNPKTVMESSRNRWSKLFLGPDFRMDNVFSLEDAGI